MATLINIGCEVADIHHRYSEIHSEIFGVSSIRLVLDAITGRMADRYGNYSAKLDALNVELSEWQKKIELLGEEDCPKGRGSLLIASLNEYMQLLKDVIELLRRICLELSLEEKSYRESEKTGLSRFSKDKEEYDKYLVQLNRLGSKLNKLFSSY